MCNSLSNEKSKFEINIKFDFIMLIKFIINARLKLFLLNIRIFLKTFYYGIYEFHIAKNYIIFYRNYY